MTFKLKILPLLLVLATAVYSQKNNIPFQSEILEKQYFLDSLKKTFVTHKLTSRLDSLWLKELANQELFESVKDDLATLDINTTVNYDLSTDLLKARLKEMDAKSPFNIEWNQGLENTIKHYLKNRKKSIERLMAISEYYFPQFEEALAKENVPLEIKYLAVVESALNPKAISKMGATGLWQFMYHTAKSYGLNIDSYVDERSDPLLASKSAALYMSKMYKIFGDWDLVLASYNSGPGNVTKAIRRANGETNYWKVRKFLPKETQNYVPAFLATMYIYEYHTAHGFTPKKAAIKHFETDTIMIKQELSFKQISEIIDVPVAQLQFMNPQYKSNVIPFYKNVPHYLRMPSDKIAVFASNEDKVYAYANYDATRKEKILFEQQKIAARKDSISQVVALEKKYKAAADKAARVNSKNDIALLDNSQSTATDTSAKASHKTESMQEAIDNEYYTVQTGDNLRKIAGKFKVSESDLKTWNDLENSTIALHSKLRISKKSIVMENDVAAIKVNNTIVHVVKKGENIWNIAEQYNLTALELKDINNLTSNEVKIGMALYLDATEKQKALNNLVAKKVIKNKKIQQYAVVKGDTLTEIANKFPGVSVDDLRKWNKIKGNNLQVGMKLKIQG